MRSFAPGEKLLTKTTCVLCVRRGGLGDTLLMLPVLRALRREHPECELQFAGVRDYARVLAHYGAVDRALSSEDLELWALRAGEGRAATTARSRLADHLAVVLDDPDLAFLAEQGLPVRAFDPVVRDTEPVPAARRWLRALGLTEAPEDLAAGLRPPRPRGGHGPVVLHAGSGSLSKCLPPEHWVDLARRLSSKGHEVIAVEGPAEVERGPIIPWPDGTTVLREPDLLDLCVLLERASAFYGHDSGVTHLAALLGAPTTAYFVNTDPHIWAHERTKVL